MALESNVEPGRIFAGQRVIHVYEIFAAGQKDPHKNPNATMQDVTGMAFLWALHRAVTRLDPHRQRAPGPLVFSKVSADGSIVISGSFNASRPSNQQRVQVTVTYPADVAGGLYCDILRRTDDGSNLVLSYGTEAVLVGVA